MTTSPSGSSASPPPESPTSRRAWARAALRRDEELELERSTGWLELFFDLRLLALLVAVLAVQIGYGLYVWYSGRGMDG